MIVAGVMSGTSADGINVALVELTGSRPQLKLLGHLEFPFPPAVRRAILAAMNAQQARVADLARLNFLLGHLYAGAVLAGARKFKVKVALIGCHGQTLYHQGEPQPFLGRKLAATWQTGEAAVMAARLDAPVVSDFRPADLAAGGKGAPLVPLLDYLLYRDRRRGRIVQNIGGIANLTAIRAAAKPEQVVAFDTGPGNMVIDAVTERLFGRPFDRDGRIAARGRTLQEVLGEILRQPFFRRPPPKTAGREEFGGEFVVEFLRRCGRARKEDVVATATALSARSIAGAIGRFLPRRYAELIVSGGGAENPTLLRMLGEEVAPWGLRIRRSDEFGLPGAAKEAVAFALLAYQTWHRRAGNIPSATGASRPAILGKISYP
ncbi:MAG: anhydro-N-acetylmuramic acid kinase [Acidobacteriota bacterium]